MADCSSMANPSSCAVRSNAASSRLRAVRPPTRQVGSLRHEYESIVRNYGNHPSLCLLSVGNELQYDFDFLNAFVAEMKVRDPRHLYTTTSFTFEKGHGGHPEPEDQYFVTQWTDRGWVRGQGVFDAEPPAFNRNYNASTEGIAVPIITHEIGQYSVYPDIKEIDRYTGSLDPLNLKAVRADLEQKGLLDRAEDWLQASGHLAALLYKEEIERAMKTRGISGYQLLGLQDFPGQGTALVGLVNAFWESSFRLPVSTRPSIAPANLCSSICSWPTIPVRRWWVANSTGRCSELMATCCSRGRKRWSKWPMATSRASTACV